MTQDVNSDVSPARTDASAAAAVATLTRDGVVTLGDLVDPVLIERCRDAIVRDGSVAHLGAGAKWTNKERFFAAVPIAGPLADERIFANPAVLAVAEAILGAGYELDSFGVIVSRPGAAQQHMHSDGKLFPATQLDRVLPAFALTFALPLVPMDAVSGTTGFVRGSHRIVDNGEEVDFAPTVPVGSGLLWDYRVRHRGLANRGDHPRPVLFAVYCRPWWRDALNFDGGRVCKIALPRATVDELDPGARRLLARAISHPDMPVAAAAQGAMTGSTLDA